MSSPLWILSTVLVMGGANPMLEVRLDPVDGSLAICRADGTGFALKNGKPRLEGDFGTLPLSIPTGAEVEEEFEDRLGYGTLRRLKFTGLPGGACFEWDIKTYSERPWVGLSGRLQGGRGLLDQIVLLEGDWRRPGGVGDLRAFIESGDQIHARGSYPVGASGIESQFITALYDTDATQAVGLGFYSLRRAWCRIRVKPAETENTYRIDAAALYRGYDLTDPRGVESESLLLDFSTDPFACLENYASCAARELGITPFPRDDLLPAIYNAWFVLGVNMTADLIQREATKLKDSVFYKYYGVRGIGTGLWQQRYHDGKQKVPEECDWGSFWGWGEDKANLVAYPNGIEDLIRRLRAMEIVPVTGMFYGYAGDGTTTFREHPEWVLPGTVDTPDDRPIDFTHPEANRWLHDLFKRWADAGADYFWTDFNAAPTEGRLHNQRIVKGFENARVGMAAIREAVGPDAIIGIYTSPIHPFAGLVDRVRVALDMGRFGNPDYLKQVIRNTAGAYFYNRVLWINDPDPIAVDPSGSSETLEEARMRVAFGVCSGGFFTLTEDFANYPPERLRLLTQALPSYGVAARPLDLMLRETPEVFHLPVQTDWGEWHVVVFVNWNDEPKTYSLSREELRAPMDRAFVVYDFWPGELLGEWLPSLEVQVPARTCRVLLLKEKPRRPDLLSTDMHVLQGAVDLHAVQWDGTTLRGTARRHPGAEGRVALYVPKGYRFVEADVPAEGAADGSTDGVMDLALTFDDAECVWSARFAPITQAN